MKMKLLMSFAVFAFAVVLTGCVSTVDGNMKAGVPFVKDTIEARYQRPVSELILAAQKVIARNGALVSNDTINNVVTGRIDTRTVWVKVTEVEPGLSAVTVQARTRVGAADILLASDIDKQIALQLATNQ